MHRRPTARLFVAVDPPPYVCEQLAAWARTALRETRRGPGAQARVLDGELLHVTLCFLGNRPTEEIDSLAALLAQCRGAAGELSVGAPLWLPPRRPRALAVELHDEQDQLVSLQRSVVAAYGEPPAEGHPDDDAAVRRARAAKHRRFRPHVTVARLRSGPDRMSKGSHGSEPTLPPTPALSFVPSELILYRSWLSPDGASYEPLASHPVT
jgi:RNA 2',3'-cyclic 3'-phosphodiesterase